jgi:RNA polymerase sigma-70 factor (ECF subfamily)
MTNAGDNRPFEELVDAARHGEHRAVAALWRGLHPRLVAYYRVAAPTEADDIASDVWIEVARGIGRFRGDADAFRRWAFTIARRRLIDHQRRAQRRRTDPVAAEDLAEHAGPDDPEAVVADALTTETALGLVRRLPPDQADAVLLRVVAGLSAEDAAKVMGKRAGAVRVLQHRGLRRLAEALGEDPGDDPGEDPEGV